MFGGQRGSPDLTHSHVTDVLTHVQTVSLVRHATTKDTGQKEQNKDKEQQGRKCSGQKKSNQTNIEINSDICEDGSLCFEATVAQLGWFPDVASQIRHPVTSGSP